MDIKKEIVPAILTNDVEDLRNKLHMLVGLTHWVQIDIMDGIFVPHTSVPIETLAELDTIMDIEVHLMTVHPERLLDACREAKVKRVIVHVEATQNVDAVLLDVLKHGFKRALALSPETPIEKVMPYVDKVDQITFLGVTPGASGQQMVPQVVEKIRTFKEARPRIPVEIDGGVNINTIDSLLEAGADIFSASSAIFGSVNPEEAIKELRNKIQNFDT